MKLHTPASPHVFHFFLIPKYTCHHAGHCALVHLQSLDERLNERKEALLEKEVVLAEVDALARRLRGQVCSGSWRATEHDHQPACVYVCAIRAALNGLAICLLHAVYVQGCSGSC